MKSEFYLNSDSIVYCVFCEGVALMYDVFDVCQNVARSIAGATVKRVYSFGEMC